MYAFSNLFVVTDAENFYHFVLATTAAPPAPPAPAPPSPSPPPPTSKHNETWKVKLSRCVFLWWCSCFQFIVHYDIQWWALLCPNFPIFLLHKCIEHNERSGYLPLAFAIARSSYIHCIYMYYIIMKHFDKTNTFFYWNWMFDIKPF